MMACLQVGDPGRAGPMFERALADLEAALGPNHPDVAHAAIDLGVLRLEQVMLPAASLQLLTLCFRRVWGAGPTEARAFGHPFRACCAWSKWSEVLRGNTSSGRALPGARAALQ